MSATPDVVYSWDRFNPSDTMDAAAEGRWVPYLEAQAMAAALQSRIDELETQLFIEKAEPALSLFEQLGLPALPAFPSVRP